MLLSLLLSTCFVSVVFSQSFQLFDDAAGEVRFRLRAANGEIVLASEGYASKQGAIGGTAAVRAAASTSTNFKVKESSSAGKYYFVLQSANGVVIGVSETYESKSNAEAGTVAVANAAAKAETIKDLTASASTTGSVFEVFQDSADQYRFRLRAINGEIILASESYVRKASALNGIESVRKNAAKLNNFDLLENNDRFRFNLKSEDNGQVIGVSESYKSAAARGIGQFAVHNGAPGAGLIDLTLGEPKEPRKGRFVLYETLSGAFRWNLKAANYAVILTSESYTTKAAAKKGIESVRENGIMLIRFAKETASNGQFYFNLKAGNHVIIGTSELYKTEASRDKGIQSVITHAALAELVDNTIDNRFIGKYEIFRDTNTGLKWYYRLKASNGQTILTSSPKYWANEDAVRAAIAKVTTSSKLDAKFVEKTSSSSKPYFVLVGDTDTEVIGYSELYSSVEARAAGIASVKSFGATATITVIAWSAPPTTTTTTVATQPGDTTTPATTTTTTAPTTTAPGQTESFVEPTETSVTPAPTFTVPDEVPPETTSVDAPVTTTPGSNNTPGGNEPNGTPAQQGEESSATIQSLSMLVASMVLVVVF